MFAVAIDAFICELYLVNDPAVLGLFTWVTFWWRDSRLNIRPAMQHAHVVGLVGFSWKCIIRRVLIVVPPLLYLYLCLPLVRCPWSIAIVHISHLSSVVFLNNLLSVWCYHQLCIRRDDDVHLWRMNWSLIFDLVLVNALRIAWHHNFKYDFGGFGTPASGIWKSYMMGAFFLIGYAWECRLLGSTCIYQKVW